MTVKLAASSHAGGFRRHGHRRVAATIHTFGTPNGGTEKTFSSTGHASGYRGRDRARQGDRREMERWRVGGGAGPETSRRATSTTSWAAVHMGVRGSLVASGQVGARFSPHGNLGYEWNGKSVLAGNVAAGVKAKLPSAVVYAAGGDMGLTQKMTLALDVIGERVTATRLSSKGFLAANGQTYPTIGFQESAYNVVSGSAGLQD